MVFGRGATAGSALVQHKRVPLISFTGGENCFVFICVLCIYIFINMHKEVIF